MAGLPPDPKNTSALYDYLLRLANRLTRVDRSVTNNVTNFNTQQATITQLETTTAMISSQSGLPVLTSQAEFDTYNAMDRLEEQGNSKEVFILTITVNYEPTPGFMTTLNPGLVYWTGTSWSDI